MPESLANSAAKEFPGRAKIVNPYRHIEATTQDGVLVLTVLESQVREYMLAEELRYELVHAVKRSKATQFILDLRNMEFMTSLACVAFIGMKHAVRERDGRLLLCNMSEFIKKILHAKRLLSRSQLTGSVAFEAVASLEDALAACKK
jgi:anti-anti-sigma factor